MPRKQERCRGTHDCPPSHSFDVRRRRAVGTRGRERSSGMRRRAPRAARASRRCGSESAVLRAALRYADDLAPIPRFAPPPRARDFVVLVRERRARSAASAKPSGAPSRRPFPSELKWLNPLKSGALFERAVDVMTFIVYEGTAMWTAALNFIGAALVIAFVAWLAVSAVRRRAFAGVAAALLAVVVALPSIGHAFEIRRSDDCRDRCGRRDDQRHAARGRAKP